MPVQHSTACALSQLFLKQVARQPKAPALKTFSEVSSKLVVLQRNGGEISTGAVTLERVSVLEREMRLRWARVQVDL